MSEKVVNLMAATRALVTYIEENHVFDKMADAGCGGIDSYRSERFDELICGARDALAELEQEQG